MKTIEIDLDRTRNLKLTNKGIIYIHEIIKINLYEGGNIFSVPPTQLGTVLCGLLMHEDPALTADAVDNMIGPENMLYVTERINLLVEAITPKPDKKARKESKTGAEAEDRPQ